jgi:histidinol dehydrogenase
VIRILSLADPAQRSEAQKLRAAAAMPEGVAETVKAIIADVRARGDAAVRELTAKYDGAELDSLFLEE